MKVQEITVGGFYHDNKDAVREVVSINNGMDGSVNLEYRILAAKVTQEYDSTRKEWVSVIGCVSSCRLSSFASWAKVALNGEGAQQLLLSLTARKIKLSPGELAFMENAMKEVGGPLSEKLRIEVAHTEGRAVSGLAKKGLLVRDAATGEAEFTPLGSAWSHSYQSK